MLRAVEPPLQSSPDKGPPRRAAQTSRRSARLATAQFGLAEFFWLAALVAVTLLTTGCSRPAGEGAAAQSASAGGTAAKPWRIGMSQCNLGEPWRVQMNADIKRAAAGRPELTVVFKDAQNDSLRQRAQVEELVAQGIDLLIISPKETAPLTKPVAEAYDRVSR